MKEAVVEIEGLSSFLYHKFNIETLTNTKNPKEGSTGNSPHEWKAKIWNEKRKLYIPPIYIHSSISEGGKYIKVGRGNLLKYIRSSLTVLDQKIYFDRELPDDIENLNNENVSTNPEEPIYIDVRAVVNPMTKGKNVRYRLALAKGWKLKFKLAFDDSIVSKEQLKTATENAGTLSGIGDARTLGHGRFSVKKFTLS